MNKWRKTTSLLFLAVASVYPVQALAAGAGDRASGNDSFVTDVRLVEEATPTTQPVGDGESISSNPTAQQVNVNDLGTVEIHVSDASLAEVLKMLSLQSQKNIIASKDVRGTVTANLYNVTIKEALDAILKSNGYGYREKGNFIYVYTVKELEQIEKAERQPVTEVFRLHYTPAKEMEKMLKPVLSADALVSASVAAEGGLTGGSGGGGGGGSSSSGGGSSGGGGTTGYSAEDTLIIRDYPENIERVRTILQEVDRRPQQVLVEATIVATRLNEDNALGVDFNILGGADFSDVVFNNLGELTGSQVTPEPLDDQAHSVGTGRSFTNNIANGIRVGFVSKNVSAFISALEEVSDTSVLANPKVLTLNKQVGEVLVGREDGYRTLTVTADTVVETVEFLQTGTRLIFRPFIGNDGYIRMEVHPEDSDGRVVNELPQKSTTEVTTNIMVKDGHTVVIGGLFRESSSRGRSQIPGLGNLPLVGALFRQQADTTAREEIIILLTPHIVKDDSAYARASEETLRDIEKLRVGIRKGMMPWGRERLAEASYEKAVKEMNKRNPSRQKALWHLNAATNLNPQFLEAIKMKESLTGRELTSVDNSSIRGFVKHQILAERNAARAEAEELQQWEAALTAPTESLGGETDGSEFADAEATEEGAQSLAGSEDMTEPLLEEMPGAFDEAVEPGFEHVPAIEPGARKSGR
jgi:type IV pilus secretin PilQ/predicted competence protein